MTDTTWSVEEARTARSICRNTKCKHKIAAESVRIARRFSSDRFTEDGVETQWFHFQCLFLQQMRMRKDSAKPQGPDDLEGFDMLTDDQQDAIRACFDGNIPDLEPEQVVGGVLTQEVSLRSNGPKRSQPKKGAAAPKAKGASAPKAKVAATAMKKANTPAGGRAAAIPALYLACETLGGTRVPLSSGTHHLGRGDLLNIRDSRCSRRQVDIVVSAGGQSAQIVAWGKNPSFLLRHGEAIEMKRGAQYALRDGDRFGLLCDQLVVTVSGFGGEVFGGAGGAGGVTVEPTAPVDPVAQPRSSGGGDVDRKRPAVAAPKAASKQPSKKRKTPTGGSQSTAAKKGSKKKPKPGDSDYESDGPNRYDLRDSFIDDGAVPDVDPYGADRLSDESSDEDFYDPEYERKAELDAIAEGRAFVRSEGSRLRRQVHRQVARDYDMSSGDSGEDDPDYYGSGSIGAGARAKPDCWYGEKCYRTHNPQHVAQFNHPHLHKKTQNQNAAPRAIASSGGLSEDEDMIDMSGMGVASGSLGSQGQ